MGIDLNIKHLIRYLKVRDTIGIHSCVTKQSLKCNQGLFAAKGIYSNWDRLGNIAAGINYLQLIKKRVTRSLGSGYQGSTHTDVDTSALVWRIAHKSRELGLQCATIDREANTNCKAVTDVIAHGHQKFEASSLATFNKKIADMKQGIPLQMEIDEIAPCQVTDITDPSLDELEVTEDLSAIHDSDEEQ
jgi:hypothetical protein